jgi:hypothetical protein
MKEFLVEMALTIPEGTGLAEVDRRDVLRACQGAIRA